MIVLNRGLSYEFILGKLPRSKYDIFVDASNSWGIGGCCGIFYFKFSWHDLPTFADEFIARKELLAALVALLWFGSVTKGKIVY